MDKHKQLPVCDQCGERHHVADPLYCTKNREEQAPHLLQLTQLRKEITRLQGMWQAKEDQLDIKDDYIDELLTEITVLRKDLLHLSKVNIDQDDEHRLRNLAKQAYDHSLKRLGDERVTEARERKEYERLKAKFEPPTQDDTQ